jgi:Na+/H+ antiporter NhaD/arsenite permease-like protein
MRIKAAVCGASASLLIASPALAAVAGPAKDLTNHWAGYASLAVFGFAYLLVISEETIHLRKSKPVMIAAGIIWALVAMTLGGMGDYETAEAAVRHNLLEFAELFLFLLAAMTYINAMDERGVFGALRSLLVSRGMSLRGIFWVTGLLSFLISPIADNLTTALLMATVVMALGASHRFVVLACINIVVAANAGGAFSPFGDITTLMVWQKGIIPFHGFFVLILPAIVNWLIPAVILSFALPREQPVAVESKSHLLDGAWVIVGLFLLTISMAVASHNFLHLPPVMGMMTGLGVLKLYGYYLKTRGSGFPSPAESDIGDVGLELEEVSADSAQSEPQAEFNIFKALERAEWDTLMFFYGIILCVGGLGTLGYLELGSQFLYGELGPTTANILVGVLSAIVDNIPIMFAVLTVLPEMSEGQWLLVTLTAGAGGSMLSIGSAAGVAVMGQARGIYTFFAHLKWSWAIGLGYAASIWVHFLVNASSFVD